MDSSSVVALVGPVDIDWVVCFHAIGWIGAIAAPLPPEPVALARALPALAPTTVLLARGVDPQLAAGVTPPSHGAAIIAAADSDRLAPERFWPLEEPRLRVLTSGSTGSPRPMTLTTAQLVFNAFGSAIRLGQKPSDSWLGCLPLDHVGGLAVLWRSAFYGTRVHLLPKFDATTANALIDAGEVSLISVVPAMLGRLLDARGDRPFPASLRAILLGGARAPTPLLARCRVINAPVAVSWGMSETASQVATAHPGELPLDDSVGAPLAFACVAADSQGHLVVTGPLAPEGSLVTTDLGSVDANGRVHVHGRADDVIVTGGRKIDPAEVEGVLRQHPSVATVAVVGAADSDLGERPVAFLAPCAGVSIPGDPELRQLCATHLPHYAIPVKFFWRETLAATALGKVARGVLRAEAAASCDVRERSSL